MLKKNQGKWRMSGGNTSQQGWANGRPASSPHGSQEVWRFGKRDRLGIVGREGVSTGENEEWAEEATANSADDRDRFAADSARGEDTRPASPAAAPNNSDTRKKESKLLRRPTCISGEDTDQGI